MSIPGAASV